MGHNSWHDYKPVNQQRNAHLNSIPGEDRAKWSHVTLVHPASAHVQGRELPKWHARARQANCTRSHDLETMKGSPRPARGSRGSGELGDMS